MTVTEEQITEALHAHAEQVDGMWSFGTGPYHNEDAARAIVEACLLLGTRVTDIATADAWVALVRKVAALEQQVNDPADFRVKLRAYERRYDL